MVSRQLLSRTCEALHVLEEEGGEGKQLNNDFPAFISASEISDDEAEEALDRTNSEHVRQLQPEARILSRIIRRSVLTTHG